MAKNRVAFFRPEIIVASFLHLMMLICKLFINHLWCHQAPVSDAASCISYLIQLYLFSATSKVFSTVCSHTRANNYFLESIDNSKCRFLAAWCNSYRDFEKGDCLPEKTTVAEMGFPAKRIKGVPVKSKFYLRTNSEEPFCIQNSIRLTNDEWIIL